MKMEDEKINVIDSDSWHCNLVDAFWPTVPTDFCSYWRALVLSLLFVFGVASMVGYVLVVGPIGLAILLITGSVLQGTGTAISIFIILFVMFILGLVIYVISQLVQKVKEKIPTPNSTNEERSLIVMKYKSWKKKMCPKIEYR
jgi:Na+-transporting methylmalonyl-CoA/oxaloacetate decarboxylase gamma subunit